ANTQRAYSSAFMATSASKLVLIRIGKTQCCQNFYFEGFHLVGFLVRFMIVALCMKHAMNYQVCGMCRQWFFLFGRFARPYVGAEDGVGLRLVFLVLGIGEGQHVGRVVLAAVDAVQLASFLCIDEA